MANLLQETIETLGKHGKTLDDVKWIGCVDFKISKEDFIRLADKTYDNGFGGVEVAADLHIVGDGWMMTRLDYDGAEWWRFDSFKEPAQTKKVSTLFRNYDIEDRMYDDADWLESGYHGMLLRHML